MSEPLAYYDEAQIGLKRHFGLFPDRVVVKGTKSRERFEDSVLLIDLRPVQSKRWTRHWIFRVGVLLLIAALVPFIMFLVFVLFGDRSVASAVWLSVAVGIALLGLASCVWKSGYVERTQFQNIHGYTILEVSRVGPEREKYESFVEQLTRAIENVHSRTEIVLRDAVAQEQVARQIGSSQDHASEVQDVSASA